MAFGADSHHLPGESGPLEGPDEDAPEVELAAANADVGNAWWLLCQDSPSVASDSQATLVERSLVVKRRRPKKWQIELMLKVA